MNLAGLLLFAFRSFINIMLPAEEVLKQFMFAKPMLLLSFATPGEVLDLLTKLCYCSNEMRTILFTEFSLCSNDNLLGIYARKN